MQERADDATFEAVRSFVAAQLGIRPARITPQTRLGEDSGVDGDDAVEFFDWFFEVFRVDPTGFNLSAHFGPEGCNPLWVIPLLLGRQRRLTPITVSDLVDAVNAGAWPHERFARSRQG